MGLLPPELDRASREELAGLEEELGRLAGESEAAEARARELMEREAKGEGPFAGEIHGLKQTKQRLAAEMRHLRVRMNWLLAGEPREG
jgi:predicted  nucleic acid-binding Zn-ribbon protein